MKKWLLSYKPNGDAAHASEVDSRRGSPRACAPPRFVVESLERRCLLSLTPINPNDAVPFNQIVIDPNPGTTPVVKLLANLTNGPDLDAVVGHENNLGGGGLDWYQFPASGNPNDPWIEHVIDPNVDVYEAARAADIAGNGAQDLVVAENGTIVWYQNPLGTGGDPATDPWVKHVIGTISQGVTHELYLADIDGDGKLDVVTNDAIFFQNSPTDWTEVANPSFNRTEKGAALFDSGSGLGAVDLAGTGNGASYDIVWYENPRDHGGNARTDPWNFHPIGPAYGDYSSGDGISYATMDVNGDGMQDIITCDGEGNVMPQGGLIWWQAPSDRANGIWIPHVIDANVQDVHNLVVADINGDGQPDLLVFEQDQSAQERLMVLYNEGGTGQNWLAQTLATTGGHNESVGDVTGDGDLDILSSPHGFFTQVNPISLWMNQLSPNGIVEPSITTSPVSHTVNMGGSVTFDVTATGSGPLTYQWELNGLDIAGATSSSYTLANVRAAQSGGVYRCIVGNPAGLIPSAGATLTVRNLSSEGTVQGNIFEDQNGTGVITGNDTLLSGRQVFLDLNNSGVLTAGDPTAVTDNTGTFTFNDVVPGTYFLHEVLPFGWKITNNGGTIPSVVVTNGQTTVTSAIANAFAAISGTVVNDVEDTGSLAAADNGLAGQHVWVDLNNDGQWEPGEPTAVTDANGNYTFYGLAPGSYNVDLYVPPWMHITSPVLAAVQTVTVGNTPADAIDFLTASGPPIGGISGAVFNDPNGDAQPDSDDSEVLSGQHVWIDLNGDGQWEPGEPATTTNANGNYNFTGLADGDYTVRYYTPPGFHQTYPGDVAAASVTVSGQTVTGVNFGVAAGAAGVYGSVFDDLNASGSQNGADPLLPNQHVWIDLQNDGQYDPGDPVAITGADGTFSFTGLADGTYTIRYYAPPGFQQTTPAGNSGQVIILAGEPIFHIVFGVAPN